MLTVKPIEAPPIPLHRPEITPVPASTPEGPDGTVALPPRNIVPRPAPLSGHGHSPWSDRSIPECFAVRSPRFLDRPALITDAGEMTFAALIRLANQVAHAVDLKAGEPPQPVALMLEHEAAVPAAILGVMKSGSFVVPIDPTYPADRNRFVLEDSTARLVITNDRHVAAVSSLGIPSSQILNLDELASGATVDFTDRQVTPDDLTSLLYTSGSTGRPKGVMRTHGSLLRNVLQHSSMQGIAPEDRIGLLFSYSNGAAMGNVFAALLNGAALVPFNVGANGVDRLADWLRERKIASFHTVPTIFRHLTDVLTTAHAFPSLRHIQLGGERMFATDLERFKRAFPAPTKLIVGMGTSEAGHLFNFCADQHTEARSDALPVGYPVDDTDIFLVDSDRRRIGPGQVGEIAVRGAFVSPGYWRQPALGARTIVPDADGAARTFFTGDMAFMLSDGCYFFAGRTDERVKIRGQAVEVAEIEAALLNAAGVSRAAVVVVGEPRRLVAFVVAQSGVCLNDTGLRAAARQRVPDAMVPAAFIVVDELPRLPSGKVDRPALVRDAASRPMQSAFVGPRTPTEQSLSSLYAEVLGLERVGIDDNFFEIGGHSLPAMQLLTKIESAFGVKLTPDVLLEKPTVRELAASLRRTHRPTSDCASLVALQTEGEKPPFFWVHGAKSNAFLPRLLGPNQPLYGFVQQSMDGRPAFHRTLPDIARYYRRGIESVQPSGPYYLGGFCNGGIVAYEIAQQLRQNGHEVRLLVLLDPPYRAFPAQWTPPWRLQRWCSRLGPGLSELIRRGARPVYRAALRVRQRIALSREALQRIAHAVRGSEHVIPQNQRAPYINAIYSRARRRYVPAPYAGPVVLMKTGDGTYDPEPVWSSLASSVQVLQLPGPHDDVVFVESQIEAVGAALKACLLETQRSDAAVSSRGRGRD